MSPCLKQAHFLESKRLHRKIRHHSICAPKRKAEYTNFYCRNPTHTNCYRVYQNNLLVSEDATFRIPLLDKVKQCTPAMLFTPLCTYAQTKQNNNVQAQLVVFMMNGCK